MFGEAFCPRGSWPINDEIHTFRISGCQHLRETRRRSYYPTRFGYRNLMTSRASKDEDTVVTRERQQLFNNIAPMYDQLNDVLSLGQHRIWKRMTVNWSSATTGDSVLDICCGSGDIALLLARKVGTLGKVIGLDFAAEQLTIAAKRQNESFIASKVNMEWVQGDALDLPFKDETFDAITMGYGLRNVVDIPKSLNEIFRVLKPGKKAAILDFNNSTNPLVASFQGFMLDNLVVPAARQFGLSAEYEYLRPSIEKFPTGPKQIHLAKEVGFKRAVHYQIGGGLMGVLVLEKEM